MSLDQKVGQLFIIGFPQQKMTDELSTFLKKTKPGAFVIFKRNMSDLSSTKRLNKSLYDLSMDYAHVPPLIAVDQEGGSVARIPTSPPMLNATAIGQANSPQLAEQLGRESATLMKELGFNMNLAPVLDVSDPFQFSFIGLRSYGSNPKIVGDMGFSFSKGLIQSGVVPTAKHFPGTGSTSADPHTHSAENNISRKDLFANHLPPFQQYARLGFFSSLMVSHSIYPNLDQTRTPAVFSKEIIQDLLRDRLKFRGLVITDDLQMSASRTLLKPEEAALAALKAGNDIVMLTWSFAEQAKAIARVKKAVQTGELPIAVVDEKLARILLVKRYLQANPKELRSLASAESQLVPKSLLRSPRLLEIDDAVLEKNLAVNFKEAEKSRGTLCVFSSSSEFLKSFESGYHSPAHFQLLEKATTSKKIENSFSLYKCERIVYTVVGKKTATMLSSLSKLIKRKTIVANLALPGLVLNSETYQKVLNLYFPHQNAGKKIAQLLNENYALND